MYNYTVFFEGSRMLMVFTNIKRFVTFLASTIRQSANKPQVVLNIDILNVFAPFVHLTTMYGAAVVLCDNHN
jgi:hypothetical protein